ncbi:MAG: mannosyltransferase [Armatimonadota bacterium]|nr:MAG: mannosyltransferase [Armatimonadota bacterium]
MNRVTQAMHRYLPVPSDIRYVSRHPPGILRWRLPPAAIHVLYVLATQRHLQRLATRLPRCNVLHVVDHSESFLVPVTPANRKVVTCHDLIPLVTENIYRHSLSRQLARWLYRMMVKSIMEADAIIACSRATASDVIRLFSVPAQKVKTVYDGVDVDFFTLLPDDLRRRKREQLGFQPHEIVILHVGSNAPYKNTPAVLRTVAHLHHSGYPVRWVKAGQPLSRSYQRLIRELDIADCLQVEADCDDLRLRDLYQSCDVLLFPSWREGFGLPVLESLACGTPAVIADTPALNEWAGTVCASAPPNDAQMMAEKVLLSAEQSRSFTARAHLREFALQFDWRIIARQIAEAYVQE